MIRDLELFLLQLLEKEVIKNMKYKIMVIIMLFLFTTSCQSKEKEKENSLTDQDKEYLINLARQTLYWYLKDGVKPDPDKSVLSKNLMQKNVCFVTLDKKNFGLRGCMGLFKRKNALYENVIDRAIAAATLDPRFPKVKYDELKNIKVEISVLTEPRVLQFDSPKDLLTKLRPLVDGVILGTRYGQSTYLPQVWEQLPGKEEFLSRLCAKHYAPKNLWKTDYKNIKVWTYQAIVFGEEVYGRRIVGKKGAVVGKKGAYLLGTVKPLQKDSHHGGYKVKEGTKLAPGAIVSADSDIIEP